MIARTIKIQLGAFAVIGIAAMTYAGTSVVLPNLVTPTYSVKAHFKDAGGTFKNGEVTYRGVNIGRIGKAELEADGVALTLNIQKNAAKIPTDVIAVVADKSAVGEEYVDLQPQSDNGPYLHQGSVIPQSQTKIPVPINTLAVDLDTTVRSVNLKDLSTLVDELSKAAENTADPVAKLLANSDSLTLSLQDSLPDTIRLINASRTDLKTAQDTSGQLRQFAQGLSALSDQLVQSDPDLRNVVDNGILASDQLNGFLKTVQPNLMPLLASVATVSEIGAARLPGLKQTVLLLPDTSGRLSQAFHNSQLYTPLTLGEDLTGKCTYDVSKRRLPADIANTPADTSEYCPNNNGTTAPRGARNAPRPKGDNTAGPATGPNDTGGPDLPVAFAGYDPVTRLMMTSDGRYYVYEPMGQMNPTIRQAVGDRSWLSLLLALSTSS